MADFRPYTKRPSTGYSTRSASRANPQVVGDQQEGFAGGPVEFPHQGEYIPAEGAVEMARGFIGQDGGRVFGQDRDSGHPLLRPPDNRLGRW